MIVDREVAELLDGRADLLAVADAVAATQARRSGVRPWRLLAVAAVIVVAVVLATIAPWRGHGNGIVQRALAAIGSGPVLHAVVERPLTGTGIVDLATGTETPVEQRVEYWYDTRNRSLHLSLEMNGRLVVDATSIGSNVNPALSAFVKGYREALASGEARRDGTGIVEGRKVVWVRLPSAGIFGERVAIDASTYRPLVIEGLGSDGKPAEVSHVTLIETVAREPVWPPTKRQPIAIGLTKTLRALAPRHAAAVLGWTPVWPVAVPGLRLRQSTLESTPGHGTELALGYDAGTGSVRIEEARQRPRVVMLGFVPPVGDAVVAVYHGSCSAGNVCSAGSGMIPTGGTPYTACTAQLHTHGVWVTIDGTGTNRCRAVISALRPVR